MVSMNRTRDILESFVIVAIILVLVQTFLEDYATLMGWSWDARRTLLFTGFAFDVFFSIEFLTRVYFNYVNRRLGTYFWYERGWVDLLASIPLLLLNSGPSMFALLSGSATIIGVGSILNVLKVVKAIRIARILRLLRVLKIFTRIKNTDSPMAQRHVAKITTVGVSILVVGVLILTMASSLLGLPSLEISYQTRTAEALEYIQEAGLASPERTRALERYVEAEPSILIVEQDGAVRYSRYDAPFYDEMFGSRDYGYGTAAGLEVFFDLRPVNQEQSRTSLFYFVLIVVMVLAYMLYYGPHFALTVSDPIHVMKRGMSDKSYSLEVKTPRIYAGDDVYQLAELYNEVYLPLKDRTGGGDESEMLNLRMGDIKDMLSE